MALGIFKQDRGTARPQHSVANLGHFQTGIDGDLNPPEFAHPFQLGHKIAQVLILHESYLVRVGKGPDGATGTSILAVGNADLWRLLLSSRCRDYSGYRRIGGYTG